MLRANVGVSRKISREFQSAGYSVNLDGEIPFGPDDSEGVLEKIQELYDLALEAINRQIERDQGNPVGGLAKDTLSPGTTPGTTPAQNAIPQESKRRSEPLPINRPSSGTGTRPTNGSSSSSGSVTPKQLQYLQTLSKRKGLSRDDLDAAIAQVVGSPKKIGDLTKREAGHVIDHLTQLQSERTA